MSTTPHEGRASADRDPRMSIRLRLLGPFARGTTPVQVGFSYPYTTSDVRFEQKFPVPLQQVTEA